MRLAVCAAFVALTGAMPDQAYEDQKWANVPNGGVSVRPFISDLAATTLAGPFPGGWSGVTDATMSPPTSVPMGGITATVSPLNLCEGNQTTNCYSTPNRVAVTFGYKASNQLVEDLGTDAVNETAEIDVTIHLNTLGQTLRWTWLNGNLTYWQVTSLGTPTGTLRIKIRPAYAPTINWQQHPGDNGCTATPIRDCTLDKADAPGRQLGVTLVLSLDQTLDSALAGAAFATSGAIIGFLNPVGGSTNPVLEYQLSSPHFQADGSTLQLGTLRAVLPQSGITQLYPGLTTPQLAAPVLAVTRVGNGQQQSTNIREWSSGTDGIVVDIDGITFSSPRYQLYRPGTGSGVTAVLSPIAAIACALLSFVLQ